jgi:hypothetical protein
MIESDPLIESITSWIKHPLAIENDRLLAALVTLRLETSTAFGLMVPRSKAASGRLPTGLGSLFAILSRQIDAWEATWGHHTEPPQIPAEEEGCHDFLIAFYGCHIRLQTSSLQLQDHLSPSSPTTPDVESLWAAYSSALRMLRLIPRHSSHVSFAQDSVHVMLAYCAAFLVKVCATSSHPIGSTSVLTRV